jgi:predicted ester cyclase
MDATFIQHYYDLFNGRRIAEAASFLADDADVECAPRPKQRGPTGYVELAEMWIRAFPDVAFFVERIEQRTETAFDVHLLARGTHSGLLELGAYQFEASGARAALHIRDLLEVRDGKILTAVVSVDFNDVVRQLTRVDYDELARRVARIGQIATDLDAVVHDTVRRREAAEKLGLELDAARRAIRPYRNR